MKWVVINGDKRRTKYFKHVFRNIEGVIYTDGIDINIDKRLVHNQSDIGAAKVMFAHLDALKVFLESGDDCAIICEDDIILRRTFEKDIDKIHKNFLDKKYDIMLLSYITFDKPNSETEYRYYYYGNYVWGTQMYMISRAHANFIIKEFENKNSTQGTAFEKTHFSADWTITKSGNRVLIYPMLGLEFTEKIYEDQGQQNARDKMRQMFYNDLFISLDEIPNV